jgi:hypothetical protein
VPPKKGRGDNYSQIGQCKDIDCHQTQCG